MPAQSSQIAIVDDDASVRKALTRLLAATEYETTAYSSVDDFLATLISNGSPECLLIDYQMPKMTGLDLQAHLNAIGIHVPIIVITAHDEPAIREICIKSGVAAFLAKPIRKKTLMASIRHAIKNFNGTS